MLLWSIWDEGGQYRQGAGKKGDARRSKKEAKGINKEDLKTEKSKNNDVYMVFHSCKVYFSYRILFNPHSAPGR